MATGPEQDRYEASFVIDVARDEVWRRLTSLRPSEASAPLLPQDPGDRWLPGWDSTSEDLEVVEGRRLRVRKNQFPCEGTEVCVELEDEGTGTRIEIVQSGFGAFWEFADTLIIGGDQIVADLAAFLSTGVVVGRHAMPWGDPGAGLTPTPAGLEVTSVTEDGWAARAGLLGDDLIVAVGGAPVVTMADLVTLFRPARPGQEIEVGFVRAGELRRSSSTV